MIDIETFKELCKLTVELTRLRQNECKHLCVQNVGPEILCKLISEYIVMLECMKRDSGQDFIHLSDCAVHNEPYLPNGKCDCVKNHYFNHTLGIKPKNSQDSMKE